MSSNVTFLCQEEVWDSIVELGYNMYNNAVMLSKGSKQQLQYLGINYDQNPGNLIPLLQAR